MTENPTPVESARRRDEWAIVLGVFAVAALLFATRRPDALLNPQFFIEDGALWYADAHEMGGIAALLHPSYRGYLHTLPRLGALAALAVPLAWAPFVMNAIAILVAAIPAAFIASARVAPILPARSARLLAAFLYVGLPGAWTTMANMTHTQWHFALLAGLVVLAAAPVTRGGRLFDLIVCLVSGLTGPTSILLAPVAALVWWARRSRWSLVLALLAAATAATQTLSILLSASESEGAAPLGASIPSFLGLVARRVVVGAFAGDAGLARLVATGGGLLTLPVEALLVAGAIAFAGTVAWKGPSELGLLLLYAALVLAASLAWPPASVHTATGYWQNLAAPSNGNRYFMIPVFALLTSLVWCAFSTRGVPRAASAAALAVVLLAGVALDWREPPLRDYGFAQYVARYERAAPGERVQVVTPPGWSFILTRR